MSDPTVPTLIPAKPWWQSKILITNVIGFAIILLTYALDPQASLHLSDQVVALGRFAVFALQTALTIFFRVGTNRPLSLTRGGSLTDSIVERTR